MLDLFSNITNDVLGKQAAAKLCSDTSSSSPHLITSPSLFKSCLNILSIMISDFRFLCLFSLLSQSHFTRAQSFTFPDQPLTVNFIDTVVFEWTTNYAQAFLLLWCQNGTPGNNVVLGSSFQVNTSGTFNYILSVQDSEQSAFPVACHAELEPTAGQGGGADSPGITFFSSPGLKAITTSFNPNASRLPAVTTTSPAPQTSPARTSSTTRLSSTSTPSSSSSVAVSLGSSLTNSPSGSTPSALTTSNTNSIGLSSTGSSTGSLTSPPPNASSAPTTVSTGATTSNNTGAIVGGIIGGLGLLCLIVFGTLILRRVQRTTASPRERRSTDRWSWWRLHQNTAMQTAGLHEKDGNTRMSRYEKDGTPVHEKEGSMPTRHEKDGGPFRRATAMFELPAESRI